MIQTTPGPVENLIFVTGRLIELMSREIELLRHMRPQEIRDLQEEKAELARAYERCMKELKDDPQILAQAGSEPKQRLKEVTARFQSILVENERALRAVKSVSERLLNTIVNAVAERQSGAAYSATGALGPTPSGNQALSLSLNERL